MTTFTYTALSSDGRTLSGSVPADTRSAAVAAVLGKGLHPVKVEEQKTTSKKITGSKTQSSLFSGGTHVSAKHVENFTRELASLLAGGVPLARSLFLLKRETKAPGPHKLWSDIHDSVIGGTSFGDTLAQYPKQFSTVYVAMVRAGEAGGFLELVLSQISEFRTREQDLKGKISAAMVYPCVLAVLAVAVLTFLMTFFIPKFSSIFAEFGANLPTLTLIILAASNLVTHYGLYVAVVIVFLVVILRRALATDSGRRTLELTILKTPALGKVVAYFAMVRFSRMLGTLLGAGVPLVASLRVAKEAIGNQILADTVALGVEQVQRGESLARALGSAERLFPPNVVEMIAIAEETGRLDKELVRLSISYESELDRQMRILVALAEPLLLFIMAALIGTVVIGMLLPIFNLQDLIK